MTWLLHQAGAEECMRNALESFEGKVDYINAHGTSTTVGDVAEIDAIQKSSLIVM